MNIADTLSSMSEPLQTAPGPATPVPLTVLVTRLEQRILSLEQLLTQLLDQALAASTDRDTLVTLLNGFTNGGSSFGAYQVDAFTQAYLGLLGPLLAVRMNEDLKGAVVEDLMKACAPLTRNALEELAAYRETQMGRDLLANAMGTTAADPWSAEPEGDWHNLEES